LLPNPAVSHLRLAAIAEAEPIAAVLQQAFAEYRPLYTPAAYAVTTPTAAQLQQRWTEGPVWVALQAGTVSGPITGTVAAVPKAESLYIRSMAILPSARGRGIGKLLLGEVERLAAVQGARRLFLSTTPFLLAAIQLYERFGFQRTPAGPHELYGTPLFTMEKALTRER
jgi:GNAT superfamily N-acetyltransferase